MKGKKLCITMMVLATLLGGGYSVMAETVSGEATAGAKKIDHFVSVHYDEEKDKGEKNFANDGAKAKGAIAIGIGAEAESEYSVAIGSKVKAKGDKMDGYSIHYYPAIAIGYNSTATGRDSVVVGRDARAEGYDAVAFGRNAIAEGYKTVALGFNAVVRLPKNTDEKGDKGAMALGMNAKSFASLATAIGPQSTANTKASMAIGYFAASYGENGISIGNTAKNGLNQMKAYGNGISIGTEAVSGAEKGIALGYKAKANAKGSLALGNESETLQKYEKSVALWTGLATDESTNGIITVGRDASKKDWRLKEINRRITHVAGGSADTDAVNIGQLKAIAEKIGYTTKEDGTISNGGDKTVLARLDALEKGGTSSTGGGTTGSSSTGEGPHFISVPMTESDKTGKNYNNDGAKGEGGIAVGINAESEYKGSIAIGNKAKGIGFNGNDVSHYAGTSIAIGEETEAKGGSVAIGEKAQGTVLGDLALGRGAKAEGVSKWHGNAGKDGLGGSIAIGNYSGATGTGAVAIGLRAKATKNLSIAIGGTGTTKADGKYAIAMGDATWALKDNSFAVGKTAQAKSEDGVAIGRGAISDGVEAIAFGQGAHATAKGSVALGTLSSTDRSYSQSIGLFTGIKNEKENTMGVISVGHKKGERRIVNVAGGSADTDAVNIGQLKAIAEKIGYTTKEDGTISNGGDKTVLARLDALEKGGTGSTGGTTGSSSTGEGPHFISVSYEDKDKVIKNYTNDGAKAKGAIAIGMESVAEGEYSIAVGTKVSAKGGKLEGYNTYYYPSIAIGYNSKAEGRDAMVIGRGSRAEGYDAVAFGRDATAEGMDTLAIGYNASAKLPKNTVANGPKGATAVGMLAKSLANCASAFGSHASANSEYSLAMGDFSGTYGTNAISIGNQAKSGKDSTKAFSDGIAIGTETASEANKAIAMGYKAKAYAQGSVAMGSEAETLSSYTNHKALFTGVTTDESINGVISVGRDKRGYTIKAINRRITHVAGGSDDTDAVNIGQLKAIAEKIGYTTKEDGTISNGGDKTVLARLDALEKGGTGSTGGTTGSSSTGEGPHFISVPMTESDKTEENYKNDGAKAKGAIAIGIKAEAKGEKSIAVGHSALASENNSAAYGSLAEAGGELSSAYGANSSATGTGSSAYGALSQAMGKTSAAYGSGSAANGDESSAYGAYSIADGVGGSAYGASSHAVEKNSAAFGIKAEATAKYSSAYGGHSLASGQTSSAYGSWSLAGAEDSVALGSYSKSYTEKGELGYAINGRKSTLEELMKTIGKSEKYTELKAKVTPKLIEKYEELRDATLKETDPVALAQASEALEKWEKENSAFVSSLSEFYQLTSPWKSGLGALSIGDSEKGFTRQIIGVAAGTADTDAVNVAQLKAIADKIGYTTKTDGTIDNDGGKTILARLDALEKGGSGSTGSTGGSVVAEGKIEENNTGTVTGGAIYTKWKGTEDKVEGLSTKVGTLSKGGHLIKKDSTLSENIVFLDEQVHKNQEALQQIKAGAGKVEFENSDTVNVETKEADGKITYKMTVKADGKAEKGNEGLVKGHTLYEAVEGEKRIREEKDQALEKAILGMNDQFFRFNQRLDSVGAGSAALAALAAQPLGGDDVWGLSAGYGHYGSENALAVGLYYHPNTDLTLRFGTAFINDENMVNAGISYRLGKRATAPRYHDRELLDYVRQVEADKQEQGEKIQSLEERIRRLEAYIKGMK